MRFRSRSRARPPFPRADEDPGSSHRRGLRARPEAPSRESTGTTLTLTTGGITLLGVLLSVGVTVALGIDAGWWIRAAAGAGTTVLLIVVVKLGTSAGRGPLARIARWTIGSGGADGS